MDWGKTIKKGALGFFTFAAAFVVTHPEMVTELIPSDVKSMTIGSLIAGILVALKNWSKHKDD